MKHALFGTLSGGAIVIGPTVKALEIAAFVGDAPQHDDMTLILIRIDEAIDRHADAEPLDMVQAAGA